MCVFPPYIAISKAPKAKNVVKVSPRAASGFKMDFFCNHSMQKLHSKPATQAPKNIGNNALDCMIIKARARPGKMP